VVGKEPVTSALEDAQITASRRVCQMKRAFVNPNILVAGCILMSPIDSFVVECLSDEEIETNIEFGTSRHVGSTTMLR
jgi:hypothetical protein